MTEITRKGFVNKNGDKVNLRPAPISATEGNLAEFGEDGRIKDSGKKTSDFAAAEHGHESIGATHRNSGNVTDASSTVATGYDGTDGAYVDVILVRIPPVPPRTPVSKSVRIKESNIENLMRALETTDTEPTEDSDNLMTSGAIFTALAGKMDAREFDSLPTQGSTKLLTSGTVYSALLNYMSSVTNYIQISANGLETPSTHLTSFVTNVAEGAVVPCKVYIQDTTSTTCLGFARWAWNTEHTQKTITLYIGEYIFTETFASDSWVGHWTKTSIASVLSGMSYSE